MASNPERNHSSAAGDARRRGARHLIAGLRISQQDEALLAVVRPFLTDMKSEGELAYRLWRRGLELTLAEVVSLGAELPAGTSKELIASLAAQRLLLCIPLLRRTGTLALLGVEATAVAMAALPPSPPSVITTIDEGASEAIANLGGSDFL